jgi:hypothetical protein
MKATKLSSPLKYVHLALVTLRGRSFPLDALRYDHATFWKEADARQAEDSLFSIVTDENGKVAPEDNPEPKERKVIVCRFGDSTNPMWTLAVWGSFPGVTFEPISLEEAEEINRDRERLPARLQYERTVSKAGR